MTAPFTNMSREQGFGSPIDEREWDLMLERRRQLVEEITARLGLANQVGSLEAADTAALTHNLMGENEDGTPTRHQSYVAPPLGHEHNQLIGAARYYGIRDPESIPRERLKQIVEARRLQVQPETNEGGPLRKGAETVAEATVAMGLGTVNELLAVAQRLPWIGDSFARSRVVQGVDQYMGEANEAMIASMTSEEASGFRTASKIGGMVGYVIPAAASWMIAGAAGKLPFIANAARVLRVTPLTRAGARGTAGIGAPATYGGAAVQGGAAAALLETGDAAGEDPRSNQEKMLMVGAGATAGVAFTYLEFAVPRMFEKIRNSFKAKTDPFARPQEAGESPVDWWFEAEQGPRRLEEGIPYGDFEIVPPGGPPGGPAPSIRVPRRDMLPETAPQPAGPIGPERQLMSPQRAALEERLHGIVEQRDVARRAAETDGLTGAGNRAALMRVRDKIDADPEMGWAVFDGKQFKAVNDRFGHDLGDQVLANFSRAIGQAAAELQLPSRIFRQGGDEFSAIVPRKSMEAFKTRAVELSRQRLTAQDGSIVETQLDGYAAETFGEADLQLMSRKRAPSGANYAEQLGNSGAAAEGQIRLTPAEQRHFNSVFSNRAELAELQAEVPSARLENGRLVVAPEHVTGLRNFVETTLIRNQGERLPPSFYRGSFADQLQLGPADAAAEGSTLTKQAILMETGDARHIITTPHLREPDVVWAAVARNPGGVSVVRGVGDAAQTVRQLVKAQAEHRLMPHNFRFVERDGQMDLLISNGAPITNLKVDQYKKHGFFEGQSATVGGREVIVVSPEAGEAAFARVIDPQTGHVHQVLAETILPGNGAPLHIRDAYPKAPKLYQDFIEHVTGVMDEGSQALGIAKPPGWLDHETSTQLPRLLDEFLDLKGITNVTERHAIEAYFNVQRVKDFQMLVPEETSQLNKAIKELEIVARARPPVAVPIEEIAAARGFNYVTTPGERGGTLIDNLSDLKIPVESPEAGFNFLRAFNREVPDYTPMSEVPVEVGNAGPHAMNPGETLEPLLEGGADQLASTLSREVRRQSKEQGTLLRDLLGEEPGVAGLFPGTPAGTGGGGVPPLPPPPRHPAGGAGSPDRLPPVEPTLGSQFAELAQRPGGLRRIEQIEADLDGILLRVADPFRRATIKIQQQLEDAGLSEGKLWENWHEVTQGKSLQHNEMHPWMEQKANVLSMFSNRKWLRDGTITRIQLITDPAQRRAAMDASGYNERDRVAQQLVDDFYTRFFSWATNSPENNPELSQQVFQYVSRVRARQGMPGIDDPYADPDNVLPRGLEFFTHMLRSGNLQFRQMDADVLMSNTVRAATFNRYVEPAVGRMLERWNDPRIPAKLRGIVTDWLQYIRVGHEPGYDAAVQGVRHALNKIGVPATDGDVARMWTGLLGNMYRARLARPDVLFRDSIQPFVAGTQIGMRHVAASYTKFLFKSTRDPMIERALRGGWVQLDQARIPTAEIFTGESHVFAEGPASLDAIMQARREHVARAADVLWELKPEALRFGIQGTALDPLKLYAKENMLGRIVAGDAGWTVANKAINAYRTELGKLTSGELRQETGQAIIEKQDRLLAQLVDQAEVDTYPRPIQEHFKSLIAAGDFEGAANLMGQEAANANFRPGTAEGSIQIRKLGMFGRFGMTFGNFTQQYVSKMQEQFLSSNIPAAKKARFAVNHGLVLATLGAAQAYTGWKFSKWMWHMSTTFAGGPLATAAYEKFLAMTGRIGESMEMPLSPAQRSALAESRRTTMGGAVFDAAASVFPFTSVIQTAGRTGTALSGPNALEATARLFVTGDRGLGSDFRQFFDRPVATPDDLNGVLAGDQNAVAKFSPEELAFIQKLAPVPAERRFGVFMQWRDRAVLPAADQLGQGAGAQY